MIEESVVSNYLRNKGLKVYLRGGKMLVKMIAYVYDDTVKGFPVNYTIVQDKIGLEFDCAGSAVERATRYAVISVFPNKRRGDFIEEVIAELYKLEGGKDLSSLEGNKENIVPRVKSFEVELAQHLIQNDFEISTLLIYIENPKYDNKRLSYEIGIADSKGTRLQLYSLPAVSNSDNARDLRIAALYTCLQIIVEAQAEISAPKPAIYVKAFGFDASEFFLNGPVVEYFNVY